MAINNETVELYWVPNIANVSAPTVAEMGNAVRLTCEMKVPPPLTMDFTSNDNPSLCSRYVPQEDGTFSTPGGTMELEWHDDTSSDFQTLIRPALKKGANGFYVRADAVNGTIPSITTPGTEVEVWPMRIQFAQKNDPASGEQKRLIVTYIVPAVPDLEAVTV